MSVINWLLTQPVNLSWWWKVSVIMVNIGSDDALLPNGPSHYLNQCWPVIHNVHHSWHYYEIYKTSPRTILTDTDRTTKYMSVLFHKDALKINPSGAETGIFEANYHQVSNIKRTKSLHLKDDRTVLRLSLPNSSKPDVKSRMKM